MRTGTECRKALHDKRKVWVLGEGLIEDVTWHPAPARSSMSMPPGMTAILTRGGGTSCSLRRTSGALTFDLALLQGADAGERAGGDRRRQ